MTNVNSQTTQRPVMRYLSPLPCRTLSITVNRESHATHTHQYLHGPDILYTSLLTISFPPGHCHQLFPHYISFMFSTKPYAASNYDETDRSLSGRVSSSSLYIEVLSPSAQLTPSNLKLHIILDPIQCHATQCNPPAHYLSQLATSLCLQHTRPPKATQHQDFKEITSFLSAILLFNYQC